MGREPPSEPGTKRVICTTSLVPHGGLPMTGPASSGAGFFTRGAGFTPALRSNTLPNGVPANYNTVLY